MGGGGQFTKACSGFTCNLRSESQFSAVAHSDQVERVTPPRVIFLCEYKVVCPSAPWTPPCRTLVPDRSSSPPPGYAQ